MLFLFVQAHQVAFEVHFQILLLRERVDFRLVELHTVADGLGDVLGYQAAVERSWHAHRSLVIYSTRVGICCRFLLTIQAA